MSLGKVDKAGAASGRGGEHTETHECVWSGDRLDFVPITPLELFRQFIKVGESEFTRIG